MKRFLILAAMLLMIFSVSIPDIARTEFIPLTQQYIEEQWYCTSCGVLNSQNYCSNCGTKRPETQVRSYEAGDLVRFGSYPYGRNGAYSSIEWIVLKNFDDSVLLLSRYGLDAIQYNSEKKDVTWETSSIRRWLNETFLYEAFSSDERALIQWAKVDNSYNQGDKKHHTDGGADTLDRVFLLSYQEVNRLFENWIDRSVYCTEYAKVNGANIRSKEKADDLFNGKGAGKSYWWLRSPANEQYRAYYINASGDYDWGDVSNKTGTVRPALWVKNEGLNRSNENGGQRIGSYSSEDAPYTSTDDTARSKKNNIEMIPCHVCYGTGLCQKCFGSGTILNDANPMKTRTCYSCSGSGSCFFCAGLGTEKKVN